MTIHPTDDAEVAPSRPSSSQGPSDTQGSLVSNFDLLGMGAAAMAWLAAGLPTLLMLSEEPARLSEPTWIAWLVLWLVFPLLVQRSIHWECRRPHRARTFLGAETLIALTLTALDSSGLAPVLLVIVAAQAGSVLPLRGAVAWVLAQTAGMVAADLWAGSRLQWVLAGGGAYLGFQLFALLTSALAERERRGREEMARLNAELVATHALLAENTRVAERVRISRELHDLLGHHLTSLSLNLEVASHLAEGKAADHVEQSRSLARLLLSDVREAVREIREDGSVDLTHPLRSLVEGVPRPEIHLSLPEPLVCDDPERAHALLRCVQEILTNTVRHARARNLWIEVEQREGEMVVRARDDGRGVAEIQPGRGLEGMRERLERLQGRLQLESARDEGFRVEARLPVPEAVS